MVGTVDVQIPESKRVDAVEVLLLNDRSDIRSSVHGSLQISEIQQQALRCGVVEELLGAL